MITVGRKDKKTKTGENLLILAVTFIRGCFERKAKIIGDVFWKMYHQRNILNYNDFS